MKDLKDYFKKNSGNGENPKPPKKNDEAKEKQCKKGAKDGKLPKTINSQEKSKKRGKYRKKDSLNISKNSEGSETKPSEFPEKFDKPFDNHCNKEMPEDMNNSANPEKENQVVVENDHSSDEIKQKSVVPSETTPELSKVNAFQFLMNSRNKIIGLNSPGKESTDDLEVTSDTSREKIAVRKKLLQAWSDSKKSKKRKLEDVEIDNCIKVKLETRKKRFKELLKIEGPDDENSEEIETHPLASREHKIKKQSSLVNFGVTLNTSSVNEVISNIDQTKLFNKKCKPLNAKIKKQSEKGIKSSNKIGNSSDDFEDNKSNIKTCNDLETNKKKKHRRKHKNIVKECKEFDSTSVPKSKNWKLRIKLTDEDCSLLKANKEELIHNQGYDDKVVILNENETKTITSNIKKDIINLDNSDEISFKENKSLKRRRSPSCKVVEKEVNNANEKNVKIPLSASKESCDKSVPNNELKRVLRNRSSLQKPVNVDFMQFSSDESGDESFIEKSKSKKGVKVAPVFEKAVPKPKVAPEILEARKKFLMSDMPDTLRRRMEKQEESMIIPEFDVFPKVSHVRQEENEEHLWNLSVPVLSLRSSDLVKYIPENLQCESIIDHSKIGQSKFDESKPIENIKTFIMNLKLQNTDYPVYRSFRLLKEKSGTGNIKVEKTTPKRRSKLKRFSGKKETKSDNTEKKSAELLSRPEFMMWTEKYKPKSSDDFIGNFQAISALKKWMESWHEAFKSGKKKTRRYSTDNESDFVSSDGGSMIGGSSLTNTIILTGPCGTGKSSSVYAICHELGLNVIELNASSKRTGKQVLQELQEATQSHQVRKNKETLFPPKKVKKESKSKIDEEANKSKKMCVLLIEDIDIVFEQDEGLISAISQISAISKRPIILTTSNEKSIYSQKFMNEFKTIKFRSLSAKSLGIWLQILCLLEGIFIDISSIGEFLEYNKGDMRKSILELQYWIQSGGQINKHKNLMDVIFEIEDQNHREGGFVQTDDDASNISLKERASKVDIFRTHSNIISDFEVFQLETFYNIPLNFDLEKIWWNIPKFLNIESGDGNRLNPLKKSRKNKTKIKIISDMYDSLALCDISYRKVSYRCDTPVCSKRWNTSLQDSLELVEIPTGYVSHGDFLSEWNHYLVDGCLNRCKKRFVNNVPGNQRLINMAVPGFKHHSEAAKNHHYEEELMDAIPISTHLQRNSVSLDYLPALRNIARSEKYRADNSEKKRHNRFYNYLQNFNVNCNNLVLNFACNTLLADS